MAKSRAEIRRQYERRDLERKSQRTGLPVKDIRKPKHPAKADKKRR